MYLSQLNISNFRCLGDVQVALSDKFNLIFGENGGGKTSLIEAVYYLGFGRSFRTLSPKNIVRWGSEKFSLFGRLFGAEADSVPIGIERCKEGQSRIRLRGKDVNSISELADVLPLQFFDYRVHHLIDGSPEIRRQFIDWGVFHVEHSSFLENWRKFGRLLKQRNAALKRRPFIKNQITLWDDVLATLAEDLTRYRQNYLKLWKPVFIEILHRLLHGEKITTLDFRFSPGWDQNMPLRVVLESSIEKDMQRGFTQFGPHRADLVFSMHHLPLKETLSRGEQKLFAIAMKIAQAVLLKKQMNKQCIFLIDDFNAELDRNYLSNLYRIFGEMGGQVFLTGADFNDSAQLLEQYPYKMFHVKQGCIEI